MSKKKSVVSRRQFLKYSMYGFSAVAVGAGTSLPMFSSRQVHAQPSVINLGMTTADVEMVDSIMVPHWLYTVNGVPSLPGPAIFAFETDTVEINVTNGIDNRDRRFAIVGNDLAGNAFALVKDIAVPGTLTIDPGDLTPGTYLYKDPTLDPISRVLGLHGALVILPDPTVSPTNPYGFLSTPNVTSLFNELGQGTLRDPAAFFPGDPWFATNDNILDYPATDSDRRHHEEFVEDPNGPQSEVFERFLYRTRIWLHSAVDPVLNRAVIDNGSIPDPATVKDSFLPQYFSINGRQGAFSSHSPDVVPMSTVGEPHVIRLLNAGLVFHSPHIHANHVYVTSLNNVVGGGGVYFGNSPGDDNVIFVDTMTLGPEDRVDWVVPFIRPPDIPRVLDGSGLLVPLDQLIPEELNTVYIKPQNPMGYPMHSHMELDQTAAGGNYPQGSVTGWKFTGEFGADFNPPPTHPSDHGNAHGHDK